MRIERMIIESIFHECQRCGYLGIIKYRMHLELAFSLIRLTWTAIFILITSSVILDMITPDVGGGETYDRMKEYSSHIKVFLSNGYSIDGEASEILERDWNGFIQKPFNMRQLSEKAMEILDNK